jgi:hypothetical protein
MPSLAMAFMRMMFADHGGRGGGCWRKQNRIQDEQIPEDRF